MAEGIGWSGPKPDLHVQTISITILFNRSRVDPPEMWDLADMLRLGQGDDRLLDVSGAQVRSATQQEARQFVADREGIPLKDVMFTEPQE